MTVVYRKDLARDGSNPALLEVYGAYGQCVETDWKVTPSNARDDSCSGIWRDAMEGRGGRGCVQPPHGMCIPIVKSPGMLTRGPQVSRVSLLQRGWVVVMCHVRGGGELGAKWHAGGRCAPAPSPHARRHVGESSMARGAAISSHQKPASSALCEIEASEEGMGGYDASGKRADVGGEGAGG